MLAGSTVKAKRRLAAVYSWPQNTRVSGGKFRSWFNEAFICLGVTLEHSAAACAEQRIAAKKRAMPPKCDVAYGMPGNLQNLEGKSQLRQVAALAVADGAGAHAQCAYRPARSPGTAPMAQQLRDAADMIGMMVSQ